MTDVAITSPANPRLRAAAGLRDRRERDRRALTIVDGAREVLRALDAGIQVDEAFVAPELVRSADAESAVRRLEDAHARIVTVSPSAFGKVAFGDRSDGVLAIVRQPPADLASLRLPADALVVVLEAVEKPGNLGAVLRTADGAGADALLVADPATDLFNPNVIRASLGTVFTVAVAAATAADVRAFLADRSIRVVAARVDGTSAPWDIDLRGSVALALGSELGGLAAPWRAGEVEAVRIPMRGAADSLNVSVAAAVLLYEARRQRG